MVPSAVTRDVQPVLWTVRVFCKVSGWSSWEEFQGEPGSSLAVCEAYNWWKGHVGAFFSWRLSTLPRHYLK